jgi:hypothetical protein
MQTNYVDPLRGIQARAIKSVAYLNSSCACSGASSSHDLETVPSRCTMNAKIGATIVICSTSRVDNKWVSN